MASRPKAWKGHLIFIKALSKVKIDYQCFLIGALDGDEKFKSNIYKQISKLNLGNKVKLTKSTNDIQSAFVLSDIVVMPSIDPEPFGRIIIEAQALKKIAIGFDHGGISESIIDNETGLLAKPLDVNDLGKKIETALQFNKTQRKIINNNAIKILKEKFSLDKMCTDTLNLYKNCIDKYN
jgi:glycosyltransferase involved in cell wall biosynthesis